MCGFIPYLEGQEDLRSRSILGITGIMIWLIGGINILTRFFNQQKSEG